jgi:hypothetical protein
MTASAPLPLLDEVKLQVEVIVPVLRAQRKQTRRAEADRIESEPELDGIMLCDSNFHITDVGAADAEFRRTQTIMQDVRHRDSAIGSGSAAPLSWQACDPSVRCRDLTEDPHRPLGGGQHAEHAADRFHMFGRHYRRQRADRALVMRGAHAGTQCHDVLDRHVRGAVPAIEQLAIAVGVILAQGVEKGFELGPRHATFGDGGDESLLRVDGPVKRHGVYDLGSPAVR